MPILKPRTPKQHPPQTANPKHSQIPNQPILNPQYPARRKPKTNPTSPTGRHPHIPTTRRWLSRFLTKFNIESPFIQAKQTALNSLFPAFTPNSNPSRFLIQLPASISFLNLII